MSSSRPGGLVVEPVSRHTHLLEVLSTITDPRKRRGRRHRLAALIAVAVCAVLAGARGFTAIGQWAADTSSQTLGALGMDRAAANESTFRRVFTLLDADLLDQV
ncbi:transposase family protein, partial [Myceligenerans cantabricum]